jgi:hypothetical protein
MMSAAGLNTLSRVYIERLKYSQNVFECLLGRQIKEHSLHLYRRRPLSERQSAKKNGS